MNQIRILHIIDSLGVGGAEMLVVNLLNSLKGYELHLIVLRKPDTLSASIKSQCRVTFLDFKSYRSIPKCIVSIRNYIKKNRIDIVHSHLYWSNVISRLSASNKEYLFNCIQNLSSKANYIPNRLSLYLEKLTYKKRHHIIAVSQSVLDDFDEWVGVKGPATILYNVIDDIFFKTLPKKNFSDNSVKLVAVGTFKKQKNYGYVMQAFKNLPPRFSLDIYGEGPLKETLQTEINANRLNIRLCGLRRDMHELLPAYDAYVMSSAYEGFSLALMEAMACGLPSFLSDIPVQRESAGSAAVYFDLNDTGDFANKIIDAFTDTGNLKIMSKAAVERANLLARKDGYIQKLSFLYENVAIGKS